MQSPGLSPCLHCGQVQPRAAARQHWRVFKWNNRTVPTWRLLTSQHTPLAHSLPQFRINSSTCGWGKAYKLLGVIAPNWLRPNVYIFVLSYFVEFEESLYWKCCKCFVFHSLELPIGWNNKKNNRRRDIFIQSLLLYPNCILKGEKCLHVDNDNGALKVQS